MVDSFCQLWLTVGSKGEATKIAKALLEKRLIICYGRLPSFIGEYWWQGKIKDNNEVLLEMLSRIDLFDQVEHEVAKLHSYDTFVLEALPISKISKKAANWLKMELGNGKP